MAAHGHYILGVPMIGGRIGGIERKAVFEFRLSRLPLPAVKPQDSRERRVGFSESRVEPESFQRRNFGFRERVLGRQVAIPSQENVRIGQTGVCESVAGIFVDGLLKVFDRFVESLFGPPIPVMAAFQVETVSFVVLGLMFS